MYNNIVYNTSPDDCTLWVIESGAEIGKLSVFVNVCINMCGHLRLNEEDIDRIMSF